MHPPIVAGRGCGKRRRKLPGTLRMLTLQAVTPLGVAYRGTSADRSCQRTKRFRDIPRECPFARTVVDELTGVRGDAQEARTRKGRGGAVAELVIELAADGQDEIRVPHRGRTHCADGRGMICRHEAAR